MKKNQPLNIARRCLIGRLPLFLFASGAVFTGSDRLFGGLSPAMAGQQLDLKPGKTALPDMALASDGGTISLSKWADRPLLINFWATWCAPCVVELPMLEAAAQILAEDNIILVLISMDRGGQQIAAPFLQERGITTPVSLYDPKAEMGRAIGLRGLPTTLLVKKNRAEYAIHTGPAEWNDKAVIEQLRAYLLG